MRKLSTWLQKHQKENRMHFQGMGSLLCAYVVNMHEKNEVQGQVAKAKGSKIDQNERNE